jgi:hypothetical protein
MGAGDDLRLWLPRMRSVVPMSAGSCTLWDSSWQHRSAGAVRCDAPADGPCAAGRWGRRRVCYGASGTGIGRLVPGVAGVVAVNAGKAGNAGRQCRMPHRDHVITGASLPPAVMK